MFRHSVSASIVMAVSLLPVAVQAETFILWGTEHKDVTTLYANGQLYQSSSCRILSGGKVTWIDARDRSSVNILDDGEVRWLTTFNNSSVDISGGNVHWLTYEDMVVGGPEDNTKRITITGGTVDYLYIPQNIIVQGDKHLNFGVLLDLTAIGVYATADTLRQIETSNITASENSSVSVSVGGVVGRLTAEDTSTVDISSGSVGEIGAVGTNNVYISGDSGIGGEECMVWDEYTGECIVTDFKRSWVSPTSTVHFLDGALAGYMDVAGAMHIYNGELHCVNAGGCHVNAGGYVAVYGGRVTWVKVDGNGTAVVSGGSVHELAAYSTSTASVSGGSVEHLTTSGSSTASVSGGSVWRVYAYSSTSTVALSGGTVKNLYAQNLRAGGPQRITITGGTVNVLCPQIRLEESEHLNYDGHLLLSDLASYGIHTTSGKVDSIYPSIVAFDTSTASVSGGSVEYLTTDGSSTASVSGGYVNQLEAYSTSTASVSGGSVACLRSSSTVNISGGSIGSIHAWPYGTVLLTGHRFELGPGLSWDADGQTILGSGLLSGQWSDGSEVWTTTVGTSSNGTIKAIAEGSLGTVTPEDPCEDNRRTLVNGTCWRFRASVDIPQIPGVFQWQLRWSTTSEGGAFSDAPLVSWTLDGSLISDLLSNEQQDIWFKAGTTSAAVQ